MLVTFDYVNEDGELHTMVARYDPKTREISLPSGWKIPVDSQGYVYYLGNKSKVYDTDGKPIK